MEMDIPHIKIDQKFARLGLNIRPSEQKIHQETSRVNVTYEESRLEIKQHPTKITAEWQQVWDDIGLKKPVTLLKEIANKGNRKTLELIGHIASHGDRLGNIASGEKNVPGNLAKEKFFRDHKVESNVGLIPKHLPEFQMHQKPPEIHFMKGDVKVNPNDISPKIDYRVSEIDVYWIQKPQVDISV